MNTTEICRLRHLRAYLQDGVAIVLFDNPEKSVNILSQAVLRDIDDCLDCLYQMASQDKLKGVVFSSAKPGVFIAGADIGEIQMAQSLDFWQAFGGSHKGQQIFTRIAKLPLCTVAAIDGRSLGGGLELALACDKIVATTGRLTVFGLPETALQIVPGWGGTQRIARKIGFMGGLSLLVLRPLLGMLNPKMMTWSAKKAHLAGLVDELIPAPSHLLPVAIKVALGGAVYSHKPSVWQRARRVLFDSSFSRRLMVAALSPLKLALGRTLPAQFEAVELVAASLDLSFEKGMDNEAYAFARLLSKPACKKAVTRFFAMQEKKKSLKKD